MFVLCFGSLQTSEDKLQPKLDLARGPLHGSGHQMCPIYLTGGLCHLAQARRVSSHASKSSSRTLSGNPGGRLPEIHLVGEVEKFGPELEKIRDLPGFKP